MKGWLNQIAFRQKMDVSENIPMKYKYIYIYHLIVIYRDFHQQWILNVLQMNVKHKNFALFLHYSALHLIKLWIC